jgi:hypothetical protein
MEELNCKQCNEVLEGKRSDAKFCRKKCRNDYWKRQNKIQNRIIKVKGKIRSEIDFQEHSLLKIGIEVEQLKLAQDAYEKTRQKYGQCRSILDASESEARRRYFSSLRRYAEKHPYEFSIVKFGTETEKTELMEELYRKYEDALPRLKENYYDKKYELEEIREKQKEHTSLKNRIERSKGEVEELKKELTELESLDLDNLPIINRKGSKRGVESETKGNSSKVSVKSYSREEILQMKFDVLRLPTELGRFIGNLHREKCAIALTGDSGAGKSTFSFSITELFLEVNLTVGYFALETGINKRLQGLVQSFEADNESFKVYPNGTLETVRLEAPKYDCVFIDSYTNISKVPKEFENLRQDFPQTIFVVIFQKTNKGTTRGGASIVFNSDAVIDIQMTEDNHRIAFMQKSRFDTENFIYSIDDKKVLKDDKNPIEWKAIKEKWPLPKRS